MRKQPMLTGKGTLICRAIPAPTAIAGSNPHSTSVCTSPVINPGIGRHGFGPEIAVTAQGPRAGTPAAHAMNKTVLPAAGKAAGPLGSVRQRCTAGPVRPAPAGKMGAARFFPASVSTITTGALAACRNRNPFFMRMLQAVSLLYNLIKIGSLITAMHHRRLVHC